MQLTRIFVSCNKTVKKLVAFKFHCEMYVVVDFIECFQEGVHIYIYPECQNGRWTVEQQHLLSRTSRPAGE
jgi:hypothetical protein